MFSRWTFVKHAYSEIEGLMRPPPFIMAYHTHFDPSMRYTSLNPLTFPSLIICNPFKTPSRPSPSRLTFCGWATNFPSAKSFPATSQNCEHDS